MNLAKFRTAVIVAASGLALLAVNAGVASGATYRPDGHVRYYKYHGFSDIVDPTAWKGQNIYNTTGRKQTNKQSTAGAYDPDNYFEFHVRIQNDGSTDRFKVRATGTGGTAKYLAGSTNITSAVVAGTYTTAQLAPGQTRIIKVRLNITDAVRLITISSVGDPTRKDAVRVKIDYAGCGC